MLGKGGGGQGIVLSRNALATRQPRNQRIAFDALLWSGMGIVCRRYALRKLGIALGIVL